MSLLTGRSIFTEAIWSEGTLTEVAWKDEGMEKDVAMNLIRWILLFFDALRLRQPVSKSPRMRMDIPLTLTRVVPIPVHCGERT